MPQLFGQLFSRILLLRSNSSRESKHNQIRPLARIVETAYSKDDESSASGRSLVIMQAWQKD
jgi:hypothetical protein